MITNLPGMVQSPATCVKIEYNIYYDEPMIVTFILKEAFEIYKKSFFANPPRLLGGVSATEKEVCCIWNPLWHELMGIYE